MIEHRLDRESSILYLRPKSALTESDFAELAAAVDPFLEETGGALAGIVLEVASFPGWDSLGALIAHLRFVRDHHRRVRKVAIVTDALLGDLAEKLASHFVAATIRRFPPGEIDAARRWVLERE
jgi:hypothetical protein